MASTFWAYIFALLLYQVTALEVQSSVTYTNGNNTKGSSATFLCNWTFGTNENQAVVVIFQTSTTNIYFSCTFINSQWVITKTVNSTRYSANSTTAGSIAMVISDLQCVDEGSYQCKVLPLSGANSVVNDSAVTIKVPPTVPTLSNFVSEIQEYLNITAVCTATLGYPNLQQIVWKTYKNGMVVDFPSDPYINATNITQPGDDRCTIRTRSTVSFKVNRQQQNLSLACFVTREDVQPSPPNFCSNPTSDMCSQTDPINVTYQVTTIKLFKEPSGALYEGGTVTLRCYSDGNPSPTYIWTKQEDENRTLTGAMDGLDNILTITNISMARDSGIFNCSVTNSVKGVIYAVSDVINLIINPPTTPPPTTTSTTTKKTSTVTSTTSPQPGTADASSTGDSDKNAIIIGVVVGVGGALIIAIIVAIVCYKRRSKPKSVVTEPAEKHYNNNSTYNINLVNANMNYKSPQPDLVASEKKMNSSSLNSSFDLKNDGLNYADLTYDNRPRSRKPMAITDNSSVYSSEVQMPEV